MPYVFCSGYYYYYCYYILSLNVGRLDPNAYCRGELEVNKKNSLYSNYFSHIVRAGSANPESQTQEHAICNDLIRKSENNTFSSVLFRLPSLSVELCTKLKYRTRSLFGFITAITLCFVYRFNKELVHYSEILVHADITASSSHQSLRICHLHIHYSKL